MARGRGLRSSGNVWIGVLFLVTLLARINQEVVFVDYYSDKCMQIAAAANLVQGHGISVAEIDYRDWSRVSYRPLHDWPPGYPLMLAAVSPLAGGLLGAAFLLDILAVVVFLIATWAIFRLLGLDSWTIVLCLLVLCLRGTLFDSQTSTDLLAFALLQAALSLLLLGLRKNRGIGFFAVVGGVLFLTGLLRYAYYPILISVPLGLIILALRRKSNAILRAAVASGSGACLGLAGVTVYQMVRVGQPVIAPDAVSSHLNFPNLLWFNNFPFTLFFSPEWSPLFSELHRLGFLTPPVVRIMGAAWTLLICALLVPGFQKRAVRPAEPDSVELYATISGWILAANCTSLAALSLRYEPQTNWTTFWTYVAEARYFVPSMMVVLTWLAILASRTDLSRVRRLGARAVLTTAVAVSISNTMIGAQVEGVARPFQPQDGGVRRFSQILREQMRSAPVLLLSPYDAGKLLAAAGCIVDARPDYEEKLAVGRIPSTQDLEVFLWTGAALSDQERVFVEVNRGERVADAEGMALYRIQAGPGPAGR